MGDLILLLKSIHTFDRERAASQIGDYLRGSRIPAQPFQQVVSALTETLSKERIDSVKECILFALNDAADQPNWKLCDMEPVAGLLESASEAATPYLLEILGASRDVRFRQLIARYLNSPNPDIKRAASDALRWL